MNKHDEDELPPEVQKVIDAKLDEMFENRDPDLLALMDSMTGGLMGLLLRLRGEKDDVREFKGLVYHMIHQQAHNHNFIQALRLQVLIDTGLSRIDKENFERQITRLYCDWMEIGSPERIDEVFPEGRDSFIGDQTLKFHKMLDFYECVKEEGLDAAMEEFGDWIQEVIHGK